MPFITINGLNTHYTEEGSGRAVVILHGWGANIETFRPVIEHWKRKYRVIAPDFPGCGKTAEPPRPYTMDDYAAFVLGLLSALEVERPVLVGHSNGGRTILKLFSQRPDYLCEKVILIDSSGIKPKKSAAARLRTGTYKTVRRVLEFPLWAQKAAPLMERARSHFGSDDYKNASPVMRRTMVNIVNEDLRHALPLVDVPALLFWGENDDMTPLSDGQMMEREIPDAGLIVLKGAGHYSYLERLPEFLRIADHFLQN